MFMPSNCALKSEFCDLIFSWSHIKKRGWRDT